MVTTTKDVRFKVTICLYLIPKISARSLSRLMTVVRPSMITRHNRWNQFNEISRDTVQARTVCGGTDTSAVIFDKDAEHKKQLTTDEASMASRQRLKRLNTKDRRTKTSYAQQLKSKCSQEMQQQIEGYSRLRNLLNIRLFHLQNLASNMTSLPFQSIFLNQCSFWASLSSSNFRNIDISNMQSQLVLTGIL